MIAAVDCGTNTIKLFVGTPPHAVVRTSRMVRLGEGVDRTGRLDDAAVQRAFAALDEYAAIIAAHDVERIRFCATSATRDASNADVFRAGVMERLGVEPEVLSGAEEAALSFGGAVAHLRHEPRLPVLVVDIGGGSTELVRGDRDAEGVLAPTGAHSMDVGSVRLHERHLAADPPTAAEVERLLADVDAALDASPVDVAGVAQVVCVAGTALTVGAGALGLPTFDPVLLDQAVVPRDAVRTEVERLLALSVEERRGLGYVHPGRADVIGAGALILDRVLERAGVDELTLSVADILDGIAASLVD
ncbi:Ppx/GppA phosphatase family protein [Nocardioides zeae]|uniref:Exopolyphosphatase/guanosine-5'-triphosphate, 3'-diphosphate pyrophosphatase n=1 Tax=Nocardioides zeae TaxID=1457234 RepID=A0AAJ1TZ63_9ACTN|nr:exopolyphosphatase [Nocardioides zeae]MDQ1104549.1 exopolyphosphatase/guanosine-5'-triphosphate,3'-diphosphate pyrophosphatase [Nocardioides zeae]